MYFKLAWRNIWRNKRRTWITVAAIGFAVFFSSFMKSAQLGSYERMIDNVARFFTGYAQVHALGYWDDKTLDFSFEANEDLIHTVRKSAHVEVAAPRIESFALASFVNQTKGSLVLGIDPEAENQLTKLKSKLVAGDYLEADDKAVLIGEGLASYLKMDVGDTLVMISTGFHGVNAAGKYVVKGLVKFPTPDMNNQIIYLPLREAQWFYGAENRLTNIAMIVDQVDNTNMVVDKLKSELDTEIYEIMGWEELLPELVESIELDYVGGLIMRYILYTVIAFGIFGTFLMMVNERKYEFGIMMAVGMHRYSLQIVVFMETILIAITGTIMGILVSLPLIVYFYFNPIYFTGEYATMFESYGMEPIMPFSMDSEIFTGQGTAVLIIASILALYPLFAIFRLKINQAIRG